MALEAGTTHSATASHSRRSPSTAREQLLHDQQPEELSKILDTAQPRLCSRRRVSSWRRIWPAGRATPRRVWTRCAPRACTTVWTPRSYWPRCVGCPRRSRFSSRQVRCACVLELDRRNLCWCPGRRRPLAPVRTGHEWHPSPSQWWREVACCREWTSPVPGRTGSAARRAVALGESWVRAAQAVVRGWCRREPPEEPARLIRGLAAPRPSGRGTGDRQGSDFPRDTRRRPRPPREPGVHGQWQPCPLPGWSDRRGRSRRRTSTPT